MFNYFEGTIYILNQIIFFILIGLFYLAGLRLGNKIIKNKNENKKGYYSIMLSYPLGFLIGFFLIDSLSAVINKFKAYSMPYSILAYWVTITLVGIVSGLIVSHIVIKKESSRAKVK